MTMTLFSRCFLGCLTVLLLLSTTVDARLSRKDRSERNKAEAEAYVTLRQQGVDEVGHTAQAAALRHYQLRKKKRKGILRRRQASLTDVLFPGVSPELYQDGEDVFLMTELVISKKTHVPFEFYDLPGCEMPVMTNFRRKHRTQRKNLGARLQGLELKPSPYTMQIKQNVSCKALCQRRIGARKVRWLRKLVERQYRIHMTFDQLPVLMRSKLRWKKGNLMSEYSFFL